MECTFHNEKANFLPHGGLWHKKFGNHWTSDVVEPAISLLLVWNNNYKTNGKYRADLSQTSTGLVGKLERTEEMIDKK